MRRNKDLFSRRAFLVSATGAAALAATAAPGAASRAGEVSGFPKEFLWGAATAGHQVEGSNINSDAWLLETVKPTIFAELSGDACDSYHRYAEDLALVKSLGLNTYRFSLEWARIEPVQGYFSIAALDYYRAVLEACKHRGLTTVVTFNHFTTPRWFAALGGWEHSDAPAMFGAFCKRAAAHLADRIDLALTMNEPNGRRLAHWLVHLTSSPEDAKAMTLRAAALSGSNRFAGFFTANRNKMLRPMIDGHIQGMAAIKAVRPDLPVGFSVAMTDDQAVGPDSQRDTMRADVYGAWLEAAATSDFLGVQTYTRARYDSRGIMDRPEEAELTQMGDEFYPEALEGTIRYAHAQTNKPIFVTENGIATEDDSRRVAYIRKALIGVQNCLKDGVPVRGYIHWSLLDNFEWSRGYLPKFGLCAVDRTTFKRTPKPSAHYFGAIARSKGRKLTSL